MIDENEDWRTDARGTNQDEYEIYISCANDGDGFDINTGEPLKTYDEWLSI